MIEAVFQRLAIQMPLARVITAVPSDLKHFGQQPGPRWPCASASALYAGNCVAPDLLGVITSENRCPRGPAPRGIVKLREAQTVASQCFKIWCGDFPTVTTSVRITHVVRHNQHDVRPGVCTPKWQCADKESDTQDKRGTNLEWVAVVLSVHGAGCDSSNDGKVRQI